jgi:hypothetical protein
LPPRRGAGDQRKRDCQNKDMAQNMTHAAMLTGRTGSRQHTHAIVSSDTASDTWIPSTVAFRH